MVLTAAPIKGTFFFHSTIALAPRRAWFVMITIAYLPPTRQSKANARHIPVGSPLFMYLFQLLRDDRPPPLERLLGAFGLFLSERGRDEAAIEVKGGDFGRSFGCVVHAVGTGARGSERGLYPAEALRYVCLGFFVLCGRE